MRSFLLRTFPLLCVRSRTFTHGLAELSARLHFRDLSLNRTDVAESAVVLHWQGTDSSLQPVLISNSDGVSALSVRLWTCI